MSQELENKDLVAAHEMVNSSHWKTVRDKLYEKLEEKTSLLDLDDKMTPEETVVVIRASKMAVKWVEDWIAEVEADAEGFIMEESEKKREDYIMQI